jgi:putative membrane protein
MPVVGIAAALALVLAGAWVVMAPGPDPQVATDGPALANDELVLATLEPNGLPTDAVLVSTLTARDRQPGVVDDPASTVNVAFVNRRGSPDTGDGVVLVEIGGPGTTTAVTEATFDKPLPVALHAEYSLDGQVVAPGDVLGATGDLTIRYTVTNTTAEQTTVRYEDGDGVAQQQQVPVFVPFAGSLDVLLPPSLEVVDDGGALRTTDPRGRTLLRYPLLLAPPLGSFQAEAVLQLRTSDGATPLATLEVAPQTSQDDPAAGFSSSALTGAVEGNAELAEGLGELGEQAGLLGDGAQALADGGEQLASGSAVLADQVGGALLSGSRALDEGAAALAAGTDDVVAGLVAAGSGADEVATGLAGLTAGLGELSAGLAALAGPDGLAQAAGSAGLLVDAGGQIADGVGTAGDGPWPPPGLLPDLPELDAGLLDPGALPPDLTPQDAVAWVQSQIPDLTSLDDLGADVPPPTLVQALRLLQQASDLLVRVSGALVASAEQQGLALADAAASSAAAAKGATALAAQVCGPSPSLTPEQCQQLSGIADDATAATESTAVAAGYAVKQKALAAALAAGLTGLERALGLVEQSVLDLSVALRSGDPSSPGLVEGLALLESGLEDAVSATALLASGAAEASEGSQALTGGAEGLASGLGDAAAGAGALAQGADALAAGTRAQTEGVGGLAAATDTLADGVRTASGASAEVAAGVLALRSEGIDEVEDAVRAAIEEPALAAAWLAATDARAADALPYGAPQGAVGHAAYRLTMPATAQGGTPAWQWGLLGIALVAGAGVLVQRRLSEPPAGHDFGDAPRPDSAAPTSAP